MTLTAAEWWKVVATGRQVERERVAPVAKGNSKGGGIGRTARRARGAVQEPSGVKPAAIPPL